MLYIIIGIIVFGILIATHELGHFLAAKACGVRVLEFAIGMGPAILKKQGKETLYTLRLLPLGGFCAMEGEDEDSEDPRAFNNKSVPRRLIILVAGATMNFITGFIIVALVFASQQAYNTPTVTGFMDGYPSQGEYGLMEGDEIYKIDGHRIYTSSNVSTYLDRSDGEADFVLIRDGEKILLENVTMERREYVQDGETVLKYGLYFEDVKTGVFAWLEYSWYTSIDFVRLVWMGLTDLVTGAVGLSELSGPVGIVDLMTDVGNNADTVGDALNNIAYIAALIAVNLAVVNLLPLPALDGGRMVMVVLTWLVERIIRRKLNPKYEGYIHTAGFALLMGLMVVVMFNDIWRIISG